VIVIFAIGIIEMLIMPAITFQLVPALVSTANNTLPAADYANYIVQVNTTIGFMHSAMYVVMLVVFIYAIVSVFKREDNEMYQP
jgi:ascorbate-specific PTS system EIIC-type component UlaA